MQKFPKQAEGLHVPVAACFGLSQAKEHTFINRACCFRLCVRARCVGRNVEVSFGLLQKHMAGEAPPVR